MSSGIIDTPGGGSVTAASVAAARTSDGAVYVTPASSDTSRGTNLLAAYAAAKLLTPNGAALSNTNRAAVIIPPGAYKVTSTLELDANYVDLIAEFPEKGGDRLPTDGDYIDPAYISTPLAQFRPPSTYIYSDAGVGSAFNVVEQSVADVRLTGFGIAQLASLADPFGDDFAADAFYCSLTDSTGNAASKYSMMYFWNRNAGVNLLGSGTRMPVNFAKHVRGEWRDCIANSYAWRCGDNGEFSAIMIDCQFGQFSIAGDGLNVSFIGSVMVRCKALGLYDTSLISGGRAFGGCETFGAAADANSLFVECEGGDRCFSLGKTTSATYLRCRAKGSSFGATATSGYVSDFAGYAEDCIAGGNSFGGSLASGFGKLTGELLRCTCTGSSLPIRAEGAVIRDSRFTVTTNNVNGITLIDSTTRIYNSDVVVVQGGTGVPIHAASALNAVVAHCRFNNASTDADGLHSNVTNLIATPYNVIDNDIA